MGKHRIRIDASNLQILGVFLAIMSIVIGFTQGWFNGLSLDAGLGANLIAVSPGVMVTVLGLLWVAKGSGAFSAVGSCAVVGIGFAILVSELFAINVLSVALMGGATLAQVETLLIVAGLVIGGVAAAGRR